jgi:hypothetical protein
MEAHGGSTNKTSVYHPLPHAPSGGREGVDLELPGIIGPRTSGPWLTTRFVAGTRVAIGILQGPPAAAKKAGNAAGATGAASDPSNASTPTAPSAPAAGAATTAPTLTAIAPDAVTVGTVPQGLDVTVTGKGFGAGTQLDLAGEMLPATVRDLPRHDHHEAGVRLEPARVHGGEPDERRRDDDRARQRHRR